MGGSERGRGAQPESRPQLRVAQPSPLSAPCGPPPLPRPRAARRRDLPRLASPGALHLETWLQPDPVARCPLHPFRSPTRLQTATVSASEEPAGRGGGRERVRPGEVGAPFPASDPQPQFPDWARPRERARDRRGKRSSLCSVCLSYCPSAGRRGPDHFGVRSPFSALFHFAGISLSPSLPSFFCPP